MFMGRWLKFAEGRYPIYQMRLFHKGRMRFRDYGHGQREDTSGRVGRLSKPYLHFNFSKGLEDWIGKHNRYSTLEAALMVYGDGPERAANDGGADAFFGTPLERRRYLKSKVYPFLPGRWLGRFLWTYVLNMGFLDGRPGLEYCLLIACYELFVTLKVAELRRRQMLSPADISEDRGAKSTPVNAHPPVAAHPPVNAHPLASSPATDAPGVAPSRDRVVEASPGR